jgi:plastocyanin
MTDWDLLTPGIGLTSIGIVGVAVSVSGIAKTFLDGMHAVSILTMFIGMIFLVPGLFKDGFPMSGRAKSATFLTLGFLVTFGVAGAVTVSGQVPSIYSYIGLMIAIGVPAAVLTVVSYRKPQYTKALGIIFISAAIVAGLTFYFFSIVAPKPPAPEEETSKAPAPAAAPARPANVISAKILAGASSEGNSDYEPDPLSVSKGDGVEWTNEDTAPHTVTSFVDDGKSFDSGIINAKATWLLDTSTLAEGDYEYFCTLHPFMRGMLTVNAAGTGQSAGESPEATTPPTTAPGDTSGAPTPAATVTAVSIVFGASAPTNGEFYSPATVETTVGSMVTWKNDDSALHTVTSGDAAKVSPDGVFDSKFMKKDQTFSFVFDKPGDYNYFCTLHPFMTGKVIVE